MTDDVRVVALYLPQYHPIPENDLWWGKGFTEWSKVVDAKPLFHGHYQPQLPGQLGFYDLRLPEAREAQAQLAGQYGIHGFCYYHYWFDGKRLLERPFTEVLTSARPNFPFCLCWVNESWTRRWDGNDKEVLIAQRYSTEGYREMIREVIPAFRDPRYIRVRGKPLFLVYRAGELPNPQVSAKIWRDEAIEAGLPGLYLCRAEARVDALLPQDPMQIGFDAAYEFPPHGMRLCKPNVPVEGLDPEFAGAIFDYTEVAREFATREAPGYRRFRGVIPSWDNTARAGRRAYMFVNSSPERYRAWLEVAVDRTRQEAPADERMIFINAWNEWGEGCHLEPDRRHGLAWLEATRAALNFVPVKMAFDGAASQMSIQQQIEHLARELGVEGASPEVVLREAAARIHSWGAELARRDDAIRALKGKPEGLVALLGEQESGTPKDDELLVCAGQR